MAAEVIVTSETSLRLSTVADATPVATASVTKAVVATAVVLLPAV